ncbi:MAG: mechanosensitive ion channel domain-containing protein [Infirmifilum sp.]
MSQENISLHIRNSMFKLIMWIVVYILVNAIIFATLPSIIPGFKSIIDPYSTYIGIGLALFFGYMIVKSFSTLVYWMLRLRHPHSTAAAVKSIFTIMGIGALAAGIAGGAAGGAAGVALGGFIGMIIGYATQQILGQAMAGLFLLLVRPVKIGDYVNVAGEQGYIEDISTLFSLIKKDDGTLALIPNNQLVGSKIYIVKKS